MKINEKHIKIVLYFAIEIFFTLSMILFLDWVKGVYLNDSVFDGYLYNCILLIALMLIWFIGPMLNRLVLFIYGTAFTLYLVAQDIYMRAFNQYFRFSTAISLRSEVTGVSDSIAEFIGFDDYLPFIVLGIICVLFFALYYFLQRDTFKIWWRVPYKLGILLLCFPLMTQFNLFNDAVNATQDKDVFILNETDYYIYLSIPNTQQFVDTFGLITFAYRDAQTLMETELFSQEDYERVESFLNNLSEPITNDYTRIFEGKNILFIQAESYIDVIADPDLTPTIWKMKNEGITVENFNTPLLTGSTSDTEFMANTSLIPNTDGYAVAYTYPYNTYSTTLATIFNEAGYNTNAFHNNYGTYYNREILFPNLGYSRFFDSYYLGLESESSDSELMNVLQWILVETQTQYMGFWITYSGHQPYDLTSVGVSHEDIAKVKEKYPDITDDYASFWAKNMDLDQALESLMTNLENAGKLDDWVFVFFGDHIVKGLDYEEGSDFYTQTGIEYSENNEYTALYIYNSATDASTYEKTATVLDLLPTIANMFNLDYDRETILGSDIFDASYDGFYFSNWGRWSTDNFTYQLVTDELTLYNDYLAEDAMNDFNYYYEMYDVSKLILKLDYFSDDEITFSSEND
ncbi:MAG: sulfatase-like hydrolase/transferase [Erysipelotrichaceae bacterium]